MGPYKQTSLKIWNEATCTETDENNNEVNHISIDHPNYDDEIVGEVGNQENANPNQVSIEEELHTQSLASETLDSDSEYRQSAQSKLSTVVIPHNNGSFDLFDIFLFRPMTQNQPMKLK